jgi:hypothetical protein
MVKYAIRTINDQSYAILKNLDCQLYNVWLSEDRQEEIWPRKWIKIVQIDLRKLKVKVCNRQLRSHIHRKRFFQNLLEGIYVLGRYYIGGTCRSSRHEASMRNSYY